MFNNQIKNKQYHQSEQFHKKYHQSEQFHNKIPPIRTIPQ